ncbi:MAG: ATP phosphoribosyltransferase [Actinobacteria bacterium]|uniref:ATP phosphoribosyltransferase n=1 Tax=Candidatus Fonsibacter lacus TaxID=2576439 RepID=A0A965LKM5_9PROT|nr:ATP phosphoribosyltransferase [Candidatus Fonsibacter lacus]
MLKIALPNKGSLAEDSIRILSEAGYRQRTDARDLVTIDSENDIEFYYLRPRDIAIYVSSGELDLGITGEDLLIDSEVNAQILLKLGYGKSTFRFALPAGLANSTTESALQGKRIATSYPGILTQALKRLRINSEIVSLDGAVESSIKLGVADAIADVVSTGTTLKQAGLAIIGEPILESEAVLIGAKEQSEESTNLIRRLTGVIIARQYVLMDYDIKSDLIDQACAITPGFESPTISPLRVEGWSAVRAMVPRKNAQKVMDDLWAIGARGILVTDIHACRL